MDWIDYTKFWISYTVNSQLKILKFQDFCITVILREINFEDSRRAKSAVFAIFGAVNFVQLVNFSLQKVQKVVKIKIHNL